MVWSKNLISEKIKSELINEFKKAARKKKKTGSGHYGHSHD